MQKAVLGRRGDILEIFAWPMSLLRGGFPEFRYTAGEEHPQNAEFLLPRAKASMLGIALLAHFLPPWPEVPNTVNLELGESSPGTRCPGRDARRGCGGGDCYQVDGGWSGTQIWALGALLGSENSKIP